MLYWIKAECQCFLAVVMSQAGKESHLTLEMSWLVLLMDPVLAVPLSNASLPSQHMCLFGRDRTQEPRVLPLTMPRSLPKRRIILYL